MQNDDGSLAALPDDTKLLICISVSKVNKNQIILGTLTLTLPL